MKKDFHDSVLYARLENLIELLSDNPDLVHEQDRFGFTALHTAVGGHTLETVTILISAGANVNAQNKYGIASLHLAAYDYIADALLDAGANIELTDISGNTPLLIHSSEPESYEVMKLLLNRRADLDKKNSNGLTALDIAKRRGEQDKVELLKLHSLPDQFNVSDQSNVKTKRIGVLPYEGTTGEIGDLGTAVNPPLPDGARVFETAYVHYIRETDTSKDVIRFWFPDHWPSTENLPVDYELKKSKIYFPKIGQVVLEPRTVAKFIFFVFFQVFTGDYYRGRISGFSFKEVSKPEDDFQMEYPRHPISFNGLI